MAFPLDGVRRSKADVWYLKPIQFEGRDTKIITQNFNGPCSFIAICNILILRRDIEILPPDRTSVSYEFLSQLLGEYLLTKSPEGVDVSSALSIMPSTTKGMDLNPTFTSITSFSPSLSSAGSAGLELFKHTNIDLLHGWIVDPSDERTEAVVSKVGDYDNAQNVIVEADVLSHGRLVAGGGADHYAQPSSPTLTDEQKQTINEASILQHFLDTTQSQLTYHGLFTLSSHMKAGEVAALFRASHLAVLFRTAECLYTLVTDSDFLNEQTVVWESLDDIDGCGTFVDSSFQKSEPVGGDFAGQNVSAYEDAYGQQVLDPADHKLAQQLQAEEDENAARFYRERQHRIQQERLDRSRRENASQTPAVPQVPGVAGGQVVPTKKKKDKCLIM